MKNNRLVLTLLVLAIWIVINAAIGRLTVHDGASVNDVLSRGLYLPVVVAVLLLFAAIWLLRWHDIGLNAPFEARSLLALWLPLVFVALTITTAFLVGSPPGKSLAFILVNTFLVGLSEELMFRGMLFAGLRSRLSIWPSIILTSLAFGALHLLNALWLGSLGAAILQAGAACCTGMLLMAIRIRTRSLDPAILFHAAWDFGLVMLVSTAQLKAGAKPEINGATIVAAAVFAVVTLSYSFFLLRKVGRSEQA